MGQSLALFRYSSADEEDDEALQRFTSKWSSRLSSIESFPDLKLLPPEISLQILSNVDARELRMCREFWEDLVNDDFLWKRLCYINWGYCTAYHTPRLSRGPHFWKSLFNTLETATDSFNTYITDEEYLGICMFQSMKVLNDHPNEIAEFLFSTDLLRTSHVLALLQHRRDVLDIYVTKHDFTGWFLPIAMRSFFFKLNLSARIVNSFLAYVFDIFSKHYCDCNPTFSQTPVTIVMLSLVMLSNDLRNPSIKNKMSKREYIKNTLQALDGHANGPIDCDYLGHTYDNIYLIGHVAPERLDGL